MDQLTGKGSAEPMLAGDPAKGHILDLRLKWYCHRRDLTLSPEYAGGLTGLASFSHAIILTYLHQARFDRAKHLKRRPQGRDDMPEVGILSQRAKNRPNPIGVTAVEVVTVGEDYVDVKGLDAIEGAHEPARTPG